MRSSRSKRPSPGPMIASYDAETAPEEARSVTGEELWWPVGGSAGVTVTDTTAMQSPALFAVLNTISTDVAMFPLRVFQRLPDGSSREAKDHVNYEVLARSPNRRSTPIQWWKTLVAHAVLSNGYAEIQRTERGRPYALHHLDPKTTQTVVEPSGKVYYRLAGGKTLPSSDVLHISGFSFDGVRGVNMVQLLRQTIGISLAADGYAADYFANGSESGGVIELPYKLQDKDAADRVRDRWEGRHRSAGNRHRVSILEEGAKYTSTSSDPQRSQILETRRWQVIDLIRSWRVPPNKAGDYSESHLANLEASNQDYVTTCLMHWLIMIEQEVNLKLFTLDEWRAGYHVMHDVSILLKGDLTARYQAYTKALRDGWMSRNEVRRKESMDPIPTEHGGDVYTVQMQVVPLTDRGAIQPTAEPPPAAEPKPAGDETRSASGPHDRPEIPALTSLFAGLPPFAWGDRLNPRMSRPAKSFAFSRSDPAEEEESRSNDVPSQDDTP